MNDKKVELSLGLVNAILAYLGKQQYEQVYQMIQAIQAEAVPQMSEQTADPAPAAE